MSEIRVFTSESVCLGHPDKVADQIADAILDAHLSQDPHSRVACEVLLKKDVVVLAGEITSNAKVDYEEVVRNTIKLIGYDDPSEPFNYQSVKIIKCIEPQSRDIAIGVDKNPDTGKPLGAGDQGIMFGYATNETPEFLPLTYVLVRKLTNLADEMRTNGSLPFLKPDGKAQVSMLYENGEPKEIAAIVVSLQHKDNISINDLREEIRKKIINKAIPEKFLTRNSKIFINPTGRFVLGGPCADSGLTGRKLIADTYGTEVHHGGGACSGKDATKVDRSASYMARYIAKNLVATGFVDKVEVALAYVIACEKPVAIDCDSFSTAKPGISESKLKNAILKVFNLTPAGMIKHLQLNRPIFLRALRTGYFGVNSEIHTWEKLDKVEELKRELNTD